MCIGIPMELVELSEGEGVVEQSGVRQRISLALLPEAGLGDYVLVHAGFAISRLDADEAAETLDLLRQAGLLPAEETPA